MKKIRSRLTHYAMSMAAFLFVMTGLSDLGMRLGIIDRPSTDASDKRAAYQAPAASSFGSLFISDAQAAAEGGGFMSGGFDD